MAAPKGTQPPGGSRKGIPNKITANVQTDGYCRRKDA
jgi:hypothetical protein